MKYFFCVFGVFCFALPYSAFAVVIINEVAWMGTLQSANDEWIELKNTGTENINLKGWVLEAGDGTPLIRLTGTSTAGGFFLLERTDDNSVPGISADQIYTGALGNNGEKLVLKNASGIAVDSIDASGGWPAGDNTTKQTMQRSSSGWVTAIATPKAQNVSAILSKQKPSVVEKEKSLAVVPNKLQSTSTAPLKQPSEDIPKQPTRADTNLYVWLVASVVAGFGIGVTGVFLKKRFANTIN
ncbi:MAG: lamin tail domain-containing protein [Patescibacteria group bacterium]